MNSRTVGMNSRTVGMNSRFVGMNSRTVGMNSRTVGMNSRTLRRNSRFVVMNSRTVELLLLQSRLDLPGLSGETKYARYIETPKATYTWFRGKGMMHGISRHG